MINTEVTYNIEFVGYIWMPQVLCGGTRTYSQDRTFSTWSQQPNWDDPQAELDAIEDKLGTDTGDYQSVKDWTCERVTKKTKFKDGKTITVTNRETIRDWDDEENELAFMDSMNPCED